MINSKKKKFVIIGYGSIGKKHHHILKSKYKQINCIIFKSKKNFDINKINKEDINYFFVCTPSDTHIFYLKKLSKFNNSFIFIEKPITNKYLKLKNLKINNFNFNRIMVGYVFRHNKIHHKFKQIIGKIKQNPFLIKIDCLSYLPNWRKNKDYKKSVTALTKKGGGIYNELSHEIDYMVWFFGKPDSVFAVENNSGNLGLKIAESSTLIFNFKNKYILNMNLSLNSKISKRSCEVNFQNYKICLDILKNKISYIKYNNIKTFNFNKKDSMYENQINNFINSNFKQNIITKNLNDSILVAKIINKIELSIKSKKIINI